jgi:hypothetical protein
LQGIAKVDLPQIAPLQTEVHFMPRRPHADELPTSKKDTLLKVFFKASDALRPQRAKGERLFVVSFEAIL